VLEVFARHLRLSGIVSPITSVLAKLTRFVCCVCTGDECCAAQLIDSSRERVVLETSRAMDDGTYRAVRLRLCTTDQVSVQLWRRVDSTTYQLRWQTTITPTARQTSLAYVTVSLSITQLLANQVESKPNKNLAIANRSRVSSELHAGPNFATRPDPTRKKRNPTRPDPLTFAQFLDPTRPAGLSIKRKNHKTINEFMMTLF